MENKFVLTSFFTSLLLHIILLLSAIFFFTEKYPIQLKAAVQNKMNVYLEANVSEAIKRETILRESDKKPRGLQKQAKSKPMMRKLEKPQEKMIGNPEVKGEVNDEFIAHIHKTIQQNQRYPEAALAMEKEGRVTVAFTIQRDGSIIHPKVITSSGSELLDNAALLAVADSSPIMLAKKFLTKDRAYQLDLVFKLTG